jgi:D-alanine-D-alanine ligase-like ATP-grasp enzyme
VVSYDVRAQAFKAMASSALDFVAVDVVWNEHEKQAYVLEINTAPGLEGATVESYARKFTELDV